MSKILGLIVILLICVSCNQKRKAEMSLSSYTHDFGIISSDIICRDSITITNVGNARLEIGERDRNWMWMYTSIGGEV